VSATIAERPMVSAELEQVRSGFYALPIAAGLDLARPRITFVAESRDRRCLGAISRLSAHAWFYLTDLWVEPDGRSRGLGSALLARLDDSIRARRPAALYAWMASFEVPWFYETHGYRCFARLPGFYAPGLDRIGFAKALIR
jgi:ribosomal protein S18 acetylase RimI-like enzyme